MASDFLTGQRAGELLWVSIDPNTHHLTGRVCERRFVAYCAPYGDREEAKQALLEAGADPSTITDEVQSKRARRGR